MVDPGSSPPESLWPPTRPTSVNTHCVPTSHFAFLVHSQETIPHNLPPNVDNKPLARQRRRRTSPEDQAILELEFQRDPKPDKQARQKIVDQVALGDKEVQIWFQNRRQNKRRRAQPLTNHATPLSPLHTSTTDYHFTDESNRVYDEKVTADEQHPCTSFTTASPKPESQHSPKLIDGSMDRSVSNGVSCLPQSRQTPSEQELSDSIVPPLHPKSSFEEEERELSNSHSADIQQRSPINSTPPFPSRVRLSLTSEGGARIISVSDTTPSPPRSQPLAPTPFKTRQTLRRSYSAVALGESPNDGARLPSIQRVPSGRSRDSRVWEFYCDNDARNELAKKADLEQTGSAADAIGLIRASSRGRLSGRISTALRTNQNKANRSFNLQQAAPEEVNVKRTKRSHNAGNDLNEVSKRREGTSLGRTEPAVAGMQTKDKTKRVHKDEKVISVYGSDSDKENRQPLGTAHISTQGRSTPRLPAKSRRTRRVLGEHCRADYAHKRPILSQLKSASASGERRNMLKNNEATNELVNPEDDKEIADFMKDGPDCKSTGIKSATNSDDDDMDCVQGLLSLSQGNWR